MGALSGDRLGRSGMSKEKNDGWEVRGQQGSITQHLVKQGHSESKRQPWGHLRQGPAQSWHLGGGGLVAKLCLTLVTPWTRDHQAPLSMGFPGKNSGVRCPFLLQRIFLTQESYLGLAHCRQTFHCLSHWGHLHPGASHITKTVPDEPRRICSSKAASESSAWSSSAQLIHPCLSLPASQTSIPININEVFADFDFQMSPAVQDLYSRKCEVYVMKIKRETGEAAL